MLNDKFAFTNQARSLGFSVPKSFKITDIQQVINFDFNQETRKYILKSIYYDSVRRLTTPQKRQQPLSTSLPISPEKPWIINTFAKKEGEQRGPGRPHHVNKTVVFSIDYKTISLTLTS